MVECQFKGKGKFSSVHLSLQASTRTLTFRSGGADGEVLRTAQLKGSVIATPKHKHNANGYQGADDCRGKPWNRFNARVMRNEQGNHDTKACSTADPEYGRGCKWIAQ